MLSIFACSMYLSVHDNDDKVGTLTPTYIQAIYPTGVFVKTKGKHRIYETAEVHPYKDAIDSYSVSIGSRSLEMEEPQCS